MARHHDRHAEASAEQNDFRDVEDVLDEEAMETAAEALRQAEVESVNPEPAVPDVSKLELSQIENMTIDELRVVARQLDIPDRSQITEKDELITEIRKRL